jgi:hypothetical protein
VLAAFFLAVGPSYITNPDVTQYLTMGFGVLAILVSLFGDQLAERLVQEGPAAARRAEHGPASDRARRLRAVARA